MNMTHPDILDSYVTGGLVSGRPELKKCVLCEESSDSGREYGNFFVCSDCGKPTIEDLLEKFDEERNFCRKYKKMLNE